MAAEDRRAKLLAGENSEKQSLLRSPASHGHGSQMKMQLQAKVCCRLSSRLQAYRYENAQLRELLIEEREQREIRESSEAHMNQQQGDKSTAKSEATKLESNICSVDSIKKQAALSEGKLALLKEKMESFKRNMELMETTMMQEHMELEKLYREPTNLLYNKQMQLGTMAAAEFQLEEITRLQEFQVEDTDMKALEPIPLSCCRMVGPSIQSQKATKLLVSGAVKATRFLARPLLLFYLVLVHLFLMYLLYRLQEQAEFFDSESRSGIPET